MLQQSLKPHGGNRLSAWYDRTLGRLIPRYAVFSLIFCILYDCFVYYASKLIVSLTGAHRYDMAISWDAHIPFRVEWITVYVACFAFWALTFIVISRQGKEFWNRFALANLIGLTVCFLFFVFVPTITTVRPEPTGEGFFDWVFSLIVAADTPVNLFPSIHCFAAWYGFCVTRGRKNLPIAYRVFTLVFSVLVCCSVVLVKQHVVVDIFAGVALAEGTWLLARKTDWYRPLQRMSDRIESAVFGELSEPDTACEE